MHHTLPFGHKGQNTVSGRPERIEIGRRIANAQHDGAAMIVPPRLHRLAKRTHRERAKRPTIKPSEIDNVAAHIHCANTGLAL